MGRSDRGVSTWERAGQRVYGWALRALPRWLRRRAGPAMAATFRERQRDRFRRRGPVGLPGLWLHELGGVVATAVRARLPEARRPAGPGGRGSGEPDGSTPPRRGGRPLEILVQDARFALRTFARHPLAMGLAVVTFGLGVGASTAMVSVVDVLLLRSLPYPEAHELVSVYPTLPAWLEIPTLADEWQRGSFSPVELHELRREQSSFDEIGGFTGRRATILGDDVPPEEVVGLAVTPGLFELLGVRPALGRSFAPDDLMGTAPVILSHGLWQRRFAADPGVTGRVLRDGDTAREIVGVMPPFFEVPGRDADFYLPFDLAGAPPNRNLHNMGAVARLADGVSLERAEEAASAILARHLPDDHARHGAFLAPLQDDLARSARGPAILLLAASLLLLVVACGSVAAILLGMGIDREDELGVRRAMGAGRSRVVMQLLNETAVLAGAATLLAVLVAGLGVDLLVRLAPTGFPGIERVGVDGRVLLIALGMGGAGALAAGLVPALTLTASDVADALRSGRRASPRAGRLQVGVVVGQLALATVLLAGAGLLGRTLLNLDRVDPGFDVDRVVAVDVSLGLHYGRLLSEDREAAGERLRLLVERVAENLRRVPGVEGVAATTDIPLGPGRANNRVWPGDREVTEEERPLAERRAVTPGYFEVLGIDLVEGRPIRALDVEAGDSVAVISEGLARALWPGRSAVDRPLSFYSGTYRVVGVAENLRDEGLISPSEMAFYVPVRQSSSTPSSFVVRISGDPAPLLPELREQVWAADPDLPVTAARPLSHYRAATVAEERYRARLMAVFASLALLFALMGIYGVTHRAVARRRRELGIRLALGAAATGIHRLILARTLRMGLAGVAVGVLLALPLARTLEGFLFGVDATDPLTLGGIGGLLLLAVVAASLGPSRRATRVDPAEALRAE